MPSSPESADTAYPPEEQTRLEHHLEPLSNRSRDERLRALIDILQASLPARDVGTVGDDIKLSPLEDAEQEVWSRTMLGIATAQNYLGLKDESEETTRIRLENGPNGQKDLSAQHTLAYRMAELGRYDEAEDMALECRDWLNGHRSAGPLSPQALAMWKVLVETAWKTGRRGIAEERIARARELVVKMKGSKFGKYAEEEGEMLEMVIGGLEGRDNV
ncbi:unnamed protein product [Zymoseptoria tritici ST99CH_3D1]|nr:unnamed protein product [Zymoseptoria tritici ST99CH_3D1]